jgi:hypothetical protein
VASFVGAFSQAGLRAGRWSLFAAAPYLLCCGSSGTNDPASRVAASCDSSCQAAIGTCNLAASGVSDCASLCDLGYTVAPSCADAYSDYVQCAGTQPIVSCTSNAVTVSGSVPPCLNPLGTYIRCAANQILPACLSLPLLDGACTGAQLGSHAEACAGKNDGCSLLDGVTQAGGLGIFCCL